MNSKGERLVRAVYDKTRGHCHFCGDRVVLGHHGRTKSGYVRGAWELDHVIQRKKGGASNPDNYLPACWKCNRLRCTGGAATCVASSSSASSSTMR